MMFEGEVARELCFVVQAHIGAILRSKLTSYRDFHTQLYTCSPEFDFLSPAYALKVRMSNIVPTLLTRAVSGGL